MRTVKRTVTAIKMDIRQSEEVIRLRRARVQELLILKEKAEVINQPVRIEFLSAEIATFEQRIAEEEQWLEQLNEEIKKPRRYR